MRALLPLVLLAPLFLAACGGGGEGKTIVVNPAPGNTVVVPPHGEPRQCPAGETSC